MYENGSEIESTNQLEAEPNTLEYRLATATELEEVLGLTESSNKTDIMVNDNQEFILQKVYVQVVDRDIDLTPIEYAQNERDILVHLRDSNTRTKFSTLEHDDISTDKDGLPTIFIKMDPDYLPLGGDKTFFTSILREERPKRLKNVIEAVHEMHEVGVNNGDLHLNNIGEVPSESDDRETEIMIIDFELGKLNPNGKLSNEDIIQDLARFAESTIRRYHETRQFEVKAKIMDAVTEVYPDLDTRKLQSTITLLMY